MKKFILILILYLTFTLTVFGADLHGTYDYRIKLTIDNTKIDATLTWIPITVLLTSTAGEEVFVEFDADADFDRVAFTKADESTELYADCEKFDDSAQIAVYHVSRDGWEISSSGDTDFYMYYDNDAGHNTTYVSKSGGTAAQSVYDANFKGVWHMNDVIVDWDTQYEGNVEPDSDGWTLTGTDYASSDGDILTIDTTVGPAEICRYHKAPDVDFDAGFYCRIKTQIHTDTPASGNLEIATYDGTQNEVTFVRIYDGQLLMYTTAGGWTTYIGIDTTSAYHIYEIYIKATTVKLYMDGVLIGTETVRSTAAGDFISFGDYSGSAALECMIDYVYYAINEAVDPTILRAIDSTSNAQHGTKINIDKPPDATGKVGQAQHFNPSDTAVEIPDQTYYRNPATVEALFKLDTWIESQKLLFQGDSGGNYWTMDFRNNYIRGIWSSTDNGGDQIIVAGDDDLSAPDTNWHQFVMTRDATNLALFYDGAAEADSGNNDDLQDLDYAYAMQMGRRKNDDAPNDDGYFDGYIDEVRISDSVRSAAWLKATYNTLWDSLLTYGAEEEGGAVDNAIFLGVNF